MRRLTQVLIAGAVSVMPLAILTGCGIECNGWQEAVLCAINNTASGNTKYTNCAGPAAICKIGLNTACWPTECVCATSADGKTKANITYYNGCGCVSDKNVKSEGTYTTSVGLCTSLNCSTKTYTENTDEAKMKSVAYKTTSCMGCSSDKQEVASRWLNVQQPRLFTNGCWSCDASPDFEDLDWDDTDWEKLKEKTDTEKATVKSETNSEEKSTEEER